ncbi:M60 family metallopeptidase [Agathobaculum sp. NTUH-O15-33]|uniref:M60 family metallopeptidase n=1 Tax=Agathobaculum sp. NTUH-O15-33 TaxID=3079302 RepID=UPI002958A0AA|nr:M60 family metallopeptidase [Agathobaculum sp. NTUH-O15-33]WNX86141.1 M60 family metallopeptidase [Agathobaculum sp. NTUH-O15-33]
MKAQKRMLSVLLAGAMLVSPVLPAARAVDEPAGRGETSVRGGISATLRLDYAQKLDEIKERNVSVTLMKTQDGKVTETLGTVALGDGARTGALDAVVSARNADGGELGGSEWPGYLDVSFGDLPRGTYSLRFSGTGYTTHEQPVDMDTYAQSVVLGTGDGTFGLGDVNGDDKVDGADWDELSGALGAVDEEQIRQYDLNGDGKIDIIDLAYISRQSHAVGEAETYNTVLLAPPVQAEALKNELEQTLVITGDVANLFQENTEPVKLTPKEDGKLDIPIELDKSVEMEVIEIATPEQDGAIQKGTVIVEDENGKKTEHPFDNTLPEGVHAIGRSAGSNVVTINLGGKVAVKKVTISVTQTASGNYAVVDTIRFLQDIVPENPVAPNSVVKTVTAAEGDAQVTLKWGELPNVTGYKVLYSLKEGGEPKELHVDVPTAVVTGLKNLQTYAFTVTPTNGEWEGRPSQVVEATPQPAKAPDAPDMVSVQALDGALNVTWGKSKNATAYEVYYTDKQNASVKDYVRAGGALSATHTSVTGLTNDTTYYLYVVAVNDAGKSGPSKIVTGTPAAVKYGEPAGLPTQLTRITRDQVQSIALKDTGNVSTSKSTKPFTTDYLMDGDYQTNWTSQSWGDGNYTRSKQLIYTFKDPVDLSYVIYVPRADGYENCMRLYGVTVWGEGDDLAGPGTVLVTMNGKNQTPVNGKMGSAKDGYFVALPFPATKGIKKLAVDIEQTGYGAVGLSEVLFFAYDETKDLDKQIDGLFEDQAHTKLRAGVTAQQISDLSAALAGDEGYYLYPNTMKDELKLAQELLAGQSAGVVLRGVTARSSSADSAKYGQGGSDLQPLGAAAKAGQEITVYAEGIPAGESVALWATQFHAEAAAWQAKVGELQNGRNVLTVPQIGSQTTPRGGSLYFTYHGANGGQITLHTRRATDVPVLELGNWHTLDEAGRKAVLTAYVQELTAYTKTIADNGKQNNCLNVTELSLPTVLLSLPATAVMDNTAKGGAEEQVRILYDNVLAWEQLMHIAKTTQGIDNTYEKNDMTSRQNIRYMQMFAGAFMYAAGSHVGVEYGSCGGLVCGKPVDDATTEKNRLFGWGVAHEIGHNMDKLGKAECTNNIYSLMVQTFDGKDNTLPSRLEGGKYPQIFTKVAEGYPGASGDVFVQLGMYWQLHLAYDNGQNDANGPMDFYNRFFKAWKAGTYFAGAVSYDDKVALTAAGTANKDLTEFFTRWGMQLSESTKTKLKTYEKEPRAIWYLDDNSRRDRLNSVPQGAGSIIATAKKEGDHQVVLSMRADMTAGKVQGYEIRRNDTVIGFTTEATYTDVIGSANHMNFAYTVQAYDSLGNAIGDAVHAGDIRVAYDKTLRADQYTIDRDVDTVTVTLTNGPTAVSGVKLVSEKALPQTGGYTVTVTTEHGDVVAKQGDYGKNEAVDDADSYLAYFNKPGTDSADSRIWTYDATKVVMTNVPENAAVQLISYAGDDVAFTEGGAAGILSADYVYGTETDDVIKAGTLVITGTYRGDPVYNTLRVKGEFTDSALDANGEPQEQTTFRYLDGYALFFAEIPEDKEVSDISDGVFIFVPNVQREAELQGGQSHCEGGSLLPSRMMAELSRTDDPNSAENQYLTASTSWISAPGGDSLPTIELKGAME